MNIIIATVASIGLTGAGCAVDTSGEGGESAIYDAIPSTVSAAVSRWQAEVDAAKSLNNFDQTSSVAEQLSKRVAIEQAARRHLPDKTSSGLSDPDWAAANRIIWEIMHEIDSENTEYLRSVLPADGWFRFSRDGERVARDAWLIVQHSPDREFQRQILEYIEPLVLEGEASGSHFALLYDRVAMFDGRRQRFGSQVICNDGRFELSPVEDAAKLDDLRASVGLEPIADYLKPWEGRSC